MTNPISLEQLKQELLATHPDVDWESLFNADNFEDFLSEDEDVEDIDTPVH